MDACQQITCNITDLGVGMRGETQLSLISHVDERFYNVSTVISRWTVYIASNNKTLSLKRLSNVKCGR